MSDPRSAALASPAPLQLRPMPMELSVASYNIHKGIGTDRKRDPGRIIDVLSEIDADVVALQEVDLRFGSRDAILDFARLEERTGLRPVPLEQRLGARASGWHGNLLLLRDAVQIEAVEALTLPGFEPRGALVADLRFGEFGLRVIAAHMGLLPGSRRAQSRQLADRIGGEDGRPTLFMGDSNEWRRGGDCGLSPLRAGLRPDPGQPAPPRCVASFPSRFPLFPLDRIFACGQVEIGELTRHESPLARRASDHLPIRARVRLLP